MLDSSRGLMWVLAAFLVACSVIRYGEETAHFDHQLPAAVPTRTATDTSGNKITLVRASINGQALGWFMLVSGSYYCIVDIAHVRWLTNLSKQDEAAIPYPCKLPVTIYRVKPFTVGTLTVKNLGIATFDLSQWKKSFGGDIVGVIGYPLFAHSVVKIDYAADGCGDRVSVFKPGTLRLSESDWRPLGLYQFQPVLTGRINRQHQAPCVIDTGAFRAVSFYSVYAARHDLLEGQPATEKQISTVCGEATVRQSGVRVFEIAGNTYERLPVSIMTPGPIVDVAPGRTAGIVGLGILQDHDVVFDLPNGRIALTPE